MKIYAIIAAILSAFMLLFPLAAVGITNYETSDTESDGQIITTENQSSEKSVYEKDSIKLLRVSSGKVIDLELYDYLVGAVSSEMPASYEKEAIKAQAVACYTYALWLMKNADSSSLSGANISDSPESHQGYLDEDELKEKWGDKYNSYNEKIKECVNAVMGEYISYGNEPIIACFHAVSPGKTGDAQDVWGRAVPYLKSVTAPGDNLSPDIDSSVTYTEDEFLKICNSLGSIKLDSDSSKWLGKQTTSDSSFVTSIEIGNKSFDGNEIRTAFSLKSPYFTCKYTDSKFTFNVKGYGHGLGMSQNSADYMARQGYTYDEILNHFYTDVKLIKP